MLVPAVAAASTSPANAPPVMATVALASLGLSGSLTDAAPDSVTGPAFSVNDLSTVPDKIGASLSAVMAIVVVVTPAPLLALPSLRVQVTVRVALEPKFVGLWLAVAKVTLSSAAR